MSRRVHVPEQEELAAGEMSATLTREASVGAAAGTAEMPLARTSAPMAMLTNMLTECCGRV